MLKKILETAFLFAIFVIFTASLADASSSDADLLKKAQSLTTQGQLKEADRLMKKMKNQDSDASDSSSMNSMILRLFCGAFGAGYFIFGKKQSRYSFLLSGIVLTVFPMVVPYGIHSIVLGIILILVPFKLDF